MAAYPGFSAVPGSIQKNALGYIAGNVVPCCKICNNAKRDMPLEDSMAWIARLTVKQQRAAEFTTTFLQTWIPVIMMASAAQQQGEPPQ